MSTQETGNVQDDGSASTPTPEVTTGTGIGNPIDNIGTPMLSGAGSTFGTARTAGGGGPPQLSSTDLTPPPPSPGDSLMASLARIEARFSGLDARQERTEDAMAVLMSTRHTTGPRRVPPTPVRFEPAGLLSESTRVNPGVATPGRPPDTIGYGSDSSAELERSHTERYARSTRSGLRGHDPADTYAGGESVIGGGGTLSQYPYDEGGQATRVPEAPTPEVPSSVVEAMTAQVAASLLKRMESDEFAHQLAKRLDIQDADTEIVNEVFRSVLTPERYRLEDRFTTVSESMRNTSHRAIRSIQTLMTGVPMFGGPNGRPLAVIGFLTSFKAAADKALVNDWLALEILPFFVDERVRGILRQASPMPGMRVAATPMDYRGILKELLSSYLSEDKCEDHYRALRTATAQSWEDEEMFGRRIQELDYELGKLLGEGELRAILFAGVPNYVRISARGANTARTNFSGLMHMCKSLGDAYRVLHPECALAPKPKGEGDKPSLTPVPRQEKVERKAAPVLVATEHTPTGEDEPLVDQQGHLLLPATPVIDEHGTVPYIAPAGTQFQVSEGTGRRVPYVRTTGYSPVTGNPHQPLPTWAVRTEAPPQIAGRPNRLGESMFRLTQGPKAYQGAGTRAPEGGNRSYGATPMRTQAGTGTSACMLCGDPHHWVSSCPLIPEESRRAAAQRKASTGGSPARAPGPAPGRQPAPGGVLAVEEAPPQPDGPADSTLPRAGNE